MLRRSARIAAQKEKTDSSESRDRDGEAQEVESVEKDTNKTTKRKKNVQTTTAKQPPKQIPKNKVPKVEEKSDEDEDSYDERKRQRREEEEEDSDEENFNPSKTSIAERKRFLKNFPTKNLRMAYSCFVSAMEASSVTTEQLVDRLSKYAHYNAVYKVVTTGRTGSYIPFFGDPSGLLFYEKIAIRVCKCPENRTNGCLAFNK